MSWFKKEGDQIKFRDSGQPARLFIVEQFGFSNYTDGEILKYLDTLAENKANGFRTFGFFPFGLGREEEPYIRAGGKFDLNRFNPAFDAYVERWVEYARQKGIVVLYELFDSVGLKYYQVENYHPFGQFVKQERDHTRRLNLFTTLGGQLEQLQRQYVAHTVNLLKKYPNVIFGVMNEFIGNAKWHAVMSQYIRSLAPQHLISGSNDSSPGTDDPNTDIWAIHTGTYDLTNCRCHVADDVRALKPKIGGKIVTYSTDGFGSRGAKCETPEAMRALAQDVVNNNVPIFRFLDQKAYVSRDDQGHEYPSGAWLSNPNAFETAQVKKSNVEACRAIAEVFKPSKIVVAETPPQALPKGFLYVFKAANLDSSHPKIVLEQGGKAIPATTTKGYLAGTPIVYSTDKIALPAKTLDAYFNVFIDSNTYDDGIILILEAYDAAQRRVLSNLAVTRKQFAKANAYNTLKLSFTPTATSQVVVRVYYYGFAYIALNQIALVDPAKLDRPITQPTDIPDVHTPFEGTGTTPPEEQPDDTQPDAAGVVSVFDVIKLSSLHPDVSNANGIRSIKATTKEGFMAFGQYAKGYPVMPLEAYFSLQVDNNAADNRKVVTVDVYDSFQQKVLAQREITRQQFPVAGAFVLFKLAFTPVTGSILEFRIFYHGYTYLAADKIAVADPAKVQFKSPSDIPGTTATPILPDKPITPPTPPQPDNTNYCTGKEIVCLAQFTPEIIAQYGQNRGGTFSGGMFTPANRGGIELVNSIDTSRRFVVDFELEGNIANVNGGELNGGKVSLFDMRQQDGNFYLSLQRMHREYRGGGKFRVIITLNPGSTEGGGFLITARELNGEYLTFNWGDESHRLRIVIEGNRCQLLIDENYQSKWAQCAGSMSGVRKMLSMIGNRSDRLPEQHAITKFKRFKIYNV